jgi:two-component system, response regulator RegA
MKPEAPLFGLDSPKLDRKHHILFVEDDAALLKTLVLEFEERGYGVTGLSSVRSIANVGSPPFDFAVVDLRIGNESGLEALTLIQQKWPHCRTVVLTGYGSIATAVQAVKQGAWNYLTKPVSAASLEKAIWLERSAEPAEIESEPPTLAKHEREYIEFVLAQCDGNISQAAQRLGLHRQSLQRKLRKFPPKA